MKRFIALLMFFAFLVGSQAQVFADMSSESESVTDDGGEREQQQCDGQGGNCGQ